MKGLCFLLLALVWAGPAWCGELTLAPRQVFDGEVAVLRWQGQPLAFGVAGFNDNVFYLYPDQEGAIALLPVGLGLPAGDYPVQAALVDFHGRTTIDELVLHVAHKERPLEQLTLPDQMVTPDPGVMARINRESVLLKDKFAQHSPRFWTTFVRPVDDPVSSIFGKRRIMNGIPKSPHSGTDFRSDGGTPVHVISSGRVTLVADLFYTGQTVVVDHGEGLFSLYAHLSKVMTDEGRELKTGDVIGLVGSTGRSTGDHLHLTVRLLGERIDPLALIALFKQ